jgi:drug/metabolite transporter (DMT)-like permease
VGDISFPVWNYFLPPVLLTRSLPLTGMGLGAIIASLEIPVSVIMALVLINELVSSIQWIGVLLILLAVVMMDMGKRDPAPE